MTEEIQIVMEMAKEKMEKAISHLEHQLVKIRAGKASPGMLEGIMVDYYGSMTPLQQVPT
ncbi:ribosome-releasing factor [Saccharicrinis fermentans DSM 9555 = JCM 21142]|uniref:Ribosome-releasing factor n=1 Tax=Saccharicrinis fermentans DSM 9555 = JCM 21142 TaxID=869213 RepID=W7Y5G2_9BACT|nr:ribosome-releasing factor [Saccharicrinis fermentans DSM 9555 = JCM 21142]